MLRNLRLSPERRSNLLNRLATFATSLPSGSECDVMRRTLFKKLVPASRPKSLSAEAQRIFLETEERCALTNEAIRVSRRNQTDFAPSNVLYTAQRKIRQILGPFDIDRMLSLSRFGPGSTYQCRGFDVSRSRKFGLTDVTEQFNKMARGLLAEYPLWAGSLTDSDLPVCPLLDPCPGGRYSTVAKDSSVDRSIIVEPTVNSWFQQGIGRMIRERLKQRSGVDLNDQTLNRRLACLGSITDDLSTIDLSSASDLISVELVRELLPDDWFTWLDLTRSHHVYLDKRWIKLEKFSSMGNGFTFDLESLIFYALTFAISEIEGYNTFWVNVFGDDIVAPSGVREPLLNVFDLCGFTVNVNKSFFKGPFRESCGHDYENGRNIRGVYLKRFDSEMDLLRIHNRIFEWSNRTSVECREILSFLRSQSTFSSKFKIPPSKGDLGFHHHFDEVCPPVARDGWEGYRYQILVPRLATRERSDRFLLLDRLQGSEFARNSVPLRTDPVGYIALSATSLWD